MFSFNKKWRIIMSAKKKPKQKCHSKLMTHESALITQHFSHTHHSSPITLLFKFITHHSALSTHSNNLASSS